MESVCIEIDNNLLCCMLPVAEIAIMFALQLGKPDEVNIRSGQFGLFVVSDQTIVLCACYGSMFRQAWVSSGRHLWTLAVQHGACMPVAAITSTSRCERQVWGNDVRQCSFGCRVNDAREPWYKIRLRHNETQASLGNHKFSLTN